jgi:hypothetical protein
MTNAQKNSPMLKATGLWSKTSVKGGQYLTGRLDGLKVLVMEKRDRQNDDDPSHYRLFVEATDRRQSGQERVQERSSGVRAPNITLLDISDTTAALAQRLPGARAAAGARPLGGAQRCAGIGALMRPEEQLHRTVVDFLSIYYIRGLMAYCHVPNGGRRLKVEAGAFKAMGVRAGVPSLLIWTPESGHFAIELKAGRRAVLSDAQVVWHSTLESLLHCVYVCRSADDIEWCLRAEAVPPVGKLAIAISADAPVGAR